MASNVNQSLAWIDPGAAFRCFGDDPDVVFFDSGGVAGERSRFSYLCLRPVRSLRVTDGVIFIDGRAAEGDVFDHLASMVGQRATPDHQSPMPFSGGLAGFIGYEVGATIDRAPRAPGALSGIPDALFGVFDTVLAFDHASASVRLFAPDEGCAKDVMRRLCAEPPAHHPVPALRWNSIVSRETHLSRVAETLRLIRAGDIYQANIAAAFEAPRPDGLNAAGLFLALRAANPAPFGAFVSCGDGCAVLSFSPERFMRLTHEGVVETRPIKGTRPRLADEADDAASRLALQASEKDRAENLMIVDLLRNDISRVADSVSVPALCALESFAHVHHLVSVVHGRMRSGLGAADLLRAAFPGGSITGAPKLRAMEVIAELEGRARGPYCGSAGWIGFDGAMDSSILIRTLTVARDRVVAQAGGGIVADSDPAAEWDEVLVKIMPLLRASGSL